MQSGSRSYRSTLLLLLQLVLLLLESSPASASSSSSGLPSLPSEPVPCRGEDGSCTCVITSGALAPKTGNFTSPSYPRRYSNGTNCQYKFIGEPHEKVQVRFHDFAVAGNPGRCQDYVDVFIKIDHPDHDSFEVPLHGRYCGQGLSAVPHLLMSWNRTLSITFASDDSVEDRGFRGEYAFIDAAPYHVGTPRSSATHCAFNLSSRERIAGTLITPYYPAMYADDMECQYQFEGNPGERIKITFEDFGLFHGGEHCPYDYVQIFDSEDSSDDEVEIAKYCGQQPRFSVYSSKQFLFVKFKTRSGKNLLPSAGSTTSSNSSGYAQLRGFNASYVFSRDFVNLDYMPPGAVHVRGSECDMRVTSLDSPAGGTIGSPYFPGPYPPNATCYYYLNGRHLGGNNFDKPSVEFTHLDIPSGDPACRKGAYLAAYLYGQDATVDSADRYLCNNTKPVTEHSALTVTSHSHRLTLKFDTHRIGGADVTGTGFQAKFRFVTNETAATSQQSCHHVMRSSSSKQGSFRFQASRPGIPSSRQAGSSKCTYDFQPSPEEYVVVSFDSIAMGFDNSVPRASSCQGNKDRVDASFATATRNASAALALGSYCGSRTPGPVATEWLPSTWLHLAVQIEPRSGSSSSGSDWIGFSGSYYFVPIPRGQDRCEVDLGEKASGIIKSPDYSPTRLGMIDCVWKITAAKPGMQIHLNPLDMDIPGSTEIGCPSAVLKVYTGDNTVPDYELCGGIERDFPGLSIISTTGRIKLRYLAIPQPGNRDLGLHRGFKFGWQLAPGKCLEYVCNVTKLCIPKHLVCNRVSNCGVGDNSDEEGCGTDSARAVGDTTALNGDVLYIIISVATVVVAVIGAALVAICLCIRRLQIKGDAAAVAAAVAVTASSISAPMCAATHLINGHTPAGQCPAGGARPADVMVTSYPPPMSYPGMGLPNGYLSLGRPYTRCPSTSSSSGGRTTMTNSTWLSGRDVDNMACLTVL